MPYQYLICVNFQTTNWDAYGSRKNDVEIIEFSALLLNTENGLIESLFHHYVRPVHFPTLSEYCISTTGITQSFIDQEKPFDDIYNKFLCWLRQMIVKRSLVFATPQNLHSSNGVLNATFCTWSDWDLGHYLYRECIRNEKSRFECMKAWIDIRRAFDQLFPNRFTFTNALDWANIHRNYNNHSGLEDANNLAKLVMHLIGLGLRFEVVTSCSY
ncbi:ERI1 exoribonuclease 2-like [Sitodiplosis mosellana]|uniref:ERI1 exoribonuclease 2-like n=1 Tax=Sitodiplosis mosellana TaxID=263140 RepID=UPI0024438F7B|nr:ERI1 exoribonuclease 2-like [Sitodiplosis mosellana]